MVRLAGEQHAQDGGADALLGGVQGTGAFGGEGEQGDGGVDGVPLGGAEGRRGADGERRAGAPAGAQGVQFDPVLVLRSGHDRGGGRGAFPQPGHVRGEPRGPPAGPVRRGGDDGARGVVERGPPVDLRGERGQQPLRAGGQGLPGQFPLGGEARGHRAVLVGGDGGGHGLADGEERGAARHLQERQALRAGGVDEGVGDVVVVHPDGEAEPDHPGAGQPLHVAAHRLPVLRVELERGDQQQLTALHVGHGVGELTGVRPADGHVEAVLARAHGQSERGVMDERGERRGHRGLEPSVCDGCVRER